MGGSSDGEEALAQHGGGLCLVPSSLEEGARWSGFYLVYSWFFIDDCSFALVLRRVKVTFIDTVLRLEHVPENSKTGAALEIRVER